MITERQLNKVIDEQVARLKSLPVVKEEDASLRTLLRKLIEDYKDSDSSQKKDFFLMVVGALEVFDEKLKGRSSEGLRIATKMKEYRRKHDLSQLELAEKLQCDRRQIVRWESGQHRPGRMTIMVFKQQGIL